MTTTKISHQILRLMLIVMGITIVIIVAIGRYADTVLTQKEVGEERQLLREELVAKLGKKLDVGLTNAVGLSTNHEFRQLLQNRDREKIFALLNEISESYKKMTNYKGIKIHVVTPELTSLVRSWDIKKFGDDVSSIESLKIVRETKKPLSGWVMGKSGFMLRTTVPIFDSSGSALGLISFAQGVGSISRDFAKKGKHYLLLLDEAYAKTSPTTLKNSQIGNYYLPNDKWFSDAVKQFGQNLELPMLLEQGYAFQNGWFVMAEPALDSQQKRIGWHIIAMPEQEVHEQVGEAKQFLHLYNLLIGLILFWVILSVYFGIRRLIVSPITQMQQQLDGISSSFDLSRPIEVKSRNEMHLIAEAINALLQSFRTALKSSQQTSLENLSISEQLSGSARQIQDAAIEESHQLENSAQKGSQVKGSLEHSQQLITQTREEIISSSRSLQDSKGQIEGLIERIQESAASEAALAERLNELNKQADEVKGVLTVIGDIADQTNLLALNAAIEAARAGEHGRGFAVVSDEVRKLAERTQKSLSEINATINVIVQSIMDATESMNQNAATMEELSMTSRQVEEKIGHLMEAMNHTEEMTSTMVEASSSSTRGTEEILGSIDTIYDLSSHNARSVEEIAQASSHLYHETRRLVEEIKRFKI